MILGQQGRTNEIFRYIYNDLTHNNRFDQNVVNQINHLLVGEIYPYLHENFELFSSISSIDDLIKRGRRKSNIIISGTIPLMIAVGFSPLPFVDIPIFLFLIATMLINIFKAYGFTIDIQILSNFFNNRHNQNAHVEEQEEQGDERILNELNQIYGNNAINENTRYIIKTLIRIISIRIGISVALGFLDFAPWGFIVAGIINAVMNTHFIEKTGNGAKDFCSNKIRNETERQRQNILNIIGGYRDIYSRLEDLINRNDWTRKIEIMNL